MYSLSSTLGHPTTKFGAHKIQVITQDPKDRYVGVHINLSGGSVDVNGAVGNKFILQGTRLIKRKSYEIQTEGYRNTWSSIRSSHFKLFEKKVSFHLTSGFGFVGITPIFVVN